MGFMSVWIIKPAVMKSIWMVISTSACCWLGYCKSCHGRIHRLYWWYGMWLVHYSNYHGMCRAFALRWEQVCILPLQSYGKYIVINYPFIHECVLWFRYHIDRCIMYPVRDHILEQLAPAKYYVRKAIGKNSLFPGHLKRLPPGANLM